MMWACVTGTKSAAPKKSPTDFWCCSACCGSGPNLPARISCSSSLSFIDEEQDILAGKFGPLPQEAIRHQKSVGEFFDATDFVPVTQAHIMADTESLGEAGVCWLERLATTVQGQRRVRIPTITDPRGTDFAKAASLGQTSAMLNLERRAISAFVKLGVVMTNTCINYQTVQAPTSFEHVAFGDTGVVIYSNSVCGARSNFEGGPSALAAGLTGRTPRYGFHLPEQRRATMHVRVGFTPNSLNEWGALGGVIGVLRETTGPYRLSKVSMELRDRISSSTSALPWRALARLRCFTW